MAQLIAFQGMPHVPAFQFWATRGLARIPGFSGVGNTLAGGIRIYFVTCVANTAHAIVGKTVTIQIGGETVTFFFNDGSGVTPPGDEEVTVVNGDTAAQCATALAAAIEAFALAAFPQGLAAGAGSGPLAAQVSIGSGDPSIPLLVTTGGAAPALAVTNNNGSPYGDALLHRAWRVFSYNGVDPALVSAFEESIADIAIPFWPLHPLGRKAWPQILNPIANQKPEE